MIVLSIRPSPSCSNSKCVMSGYLVVQHMVVVVVALSSLMKILGECSTIHSAPVFFFK